MKQPEILVINTGSTSTKIGFFKGENNVFEHQESYNPEELSNLNSFEEKVFFRKEKIIKILKEKKINLSSIDIFICRGGLLKPVTSGIYKVNDKMLSDLKNSKRQHASNLAAVLGYELSPVKTNVYIADPVVVDELQDIARFSGHKNFERISVFHALNHKAVGRRFALETDKDYENLNLIIVHLGGGISIGAHQKGRVVDVNQALDGEGPFSPERSGTLPSGDLVREAFLGKYNKSEILKMIVGKGGLVSYLDTNDVRKIENNFNDYSKKVLSAMAYQISKYIGEMAVVLRGNIDAIILTGGLAHSTFITKEVKKQVDFLAPVVIYPGEDEMKSLASNALLLWNNTLQAKDYD